MLKIVKEAQAKFAKIEEDNKRLSDEVARLDKVNYDLRAEYNVMDSSNKDCKAIAERVGPRLKAEVRTFERWAGYLRERQQHPDRIARTVVLKLKTREFRILTRSLTPPLPPTKATVRPSGSAFGSA